MLNHRRASAGPPERVVVIGAGGFVGAAVAARAARAGIPVLGLTRADVDLLSPGAATILRDLLRDGDAVVAAAARAPVRDARMLVDNMIMAQAMLEAIAARGVAHVVNIGSDAIYADSDAPLVEESPAGPDSLHGAMHLARELMFRAGLSAPLALLRPTLIYGARDPHNGYGPNRFRRTALRGEDIVLFGEGEERRDHIHIDDVAELVLRVLRHESTGALNLATGAVVSFKAVADIVARLAGGTTVRGSPRQGPMPHGGYRPFDVAACRAAFPDFRCLSIEDGLALCHRQEVNGK